MNMKLIKQAVKLFVETMDMEKVDIDTESHKWHDLYSKECQLFAIFPKFTEAEAAEYRIRVSAIERQAETIKVLTEAGLDMDRTDVKIADNGIMVQYGYWEAIPTSILMTVRFWLNITAEDMYDDDCGHLVGYFVNKRINSKVLY
jgi:hypothetical protein